MVYFYGMRTIFSKAVPIIVRTNQINIEYINVEASTVRNY